ncbi:hypothetical protein F5Y14DRAFT_371938 [Nemania sp. NC0429]|nr:hypothetical protein F5Y14DRAFT_371938 [Nemania sp. NC0429]
MLMRLPSLLAPLVLLGSTTSAAPGAQPVSPRAAQRCYKGEITDLLCYNAPDSDPQNVDVADVAHIASYLRAYGAQTKAGRLFTMAAAAAPDCGEWSVYAHGTALALAKHINGSVDSSVLFADIATTIDGGANATSKQLGAALMGCGSSGGSFGVQVNAADPAYTAATYPAGYTPGGLLIKIVASGA